MIGAETLQAARALVAKGVRIKFEAQKVHRLDPLSGIILYDRTELSDKEANAFSHYLSAWSGVDLADQDEYLIGYYNACVEDEGPSASLGVELMRVRERFPDADIHIERR